MEDPPSITNFPHILDRIAAYLSKDDYARCTLVSKDFQSHFKPLLWRDISIKKLPNVIPEPYKDALLTNGHLIRALHAGHFSVTAFLASSTSTCQNLRELNTSLDGREAEESLNCNMDLVDKNPNLRHWCMAYHHPDSYITYVRLLEMLANHQQLESLVMFGISPDIDIHQDLLEYLPSKIEWVSANILRLATSNSVNPDSRLFPRPQNMRLQPYHRLRFLDSKLHLLKGSEADFMSHLRQCPNLEALTIPFMDDENLAKLAVLLSDAEQFPKLNSLCLERQNPHTPRTTFALIRALKGRIRHFELEDYNNASPAKHYCSVLSTDCATTLESIEFGVEAIVSCFDVQLIATSCTGLKQLIIRSNATELESQNVGSPEESLSGWKAIFVDERTGQEDTWRCTGLETLTITILNDRWVNADESLDPRRSAAYGVKRAYRQIGRLTKLKRLTLGWLSSRGLPVERRVDMSLRSGLGYLGSLVELRELEYRGVPHPKIGRAEVEWMAQHWPKLRMIRCKRQKRFLETSIYAEGEPEIDPVMGEILEPKTDYGYLEALLALRPNLEIE